MNLLPLQSNKTISNFFKYFSFIWSYSIIFQINTNILYLYNNYVSFKNLLFKYKNYIIPKKFKNKEKRKKRLFKKLNVKFFNYYYFLSSYTFRKKKLNFLQNKKINNTSRLFSFSPLFSISNYSKIITQYKIRASSVFLIKSIKNIYLNLYFSYWNVYKKSLLLSKKKIKYLPRLSNFSNINNLSKNTRVRSIWARHVSSFSLIYMRKRLQFALDRHFLYQKPFTKFLLTLYTLKSTNFLYWHELKLSNVLLKSSFFFSMQDILFFIKKKLLLLNYNIIFSISCNLKIYDILIVKYNIFTFNFFKKSLIGLNLLYFNYMHFFYKIQKKLFRKYPKTPTYRITNKIFKKKYFLILPTIYLEVDWLTLSIILLNIFFFFKFYFFNNNITNLANSSIRAYNWKYLN